MNFISFICPYCKFLKFQTSRSLINHQKYCSIKNNKVVKSLSIDSNQKRSGSPDQSNIEISKISRTNDNTSGILSPSIGMRLIAEEKKKMNQ